MEFDLSTLQPKERASFALRALYEAAGCRKYHMGRFEEYGLYQENRSFLSSEQVITFTDLDGRLLALKPDVTLSIAKTAQPAPGDVDLDGHRHGVDSHDCSRIGPDKHSASFFRGSAYQKGASSPSDVEALISNSPPPGAAPRPPPGTPPTGAFEPLA